MKTLVGICQNCGRSMEGHDPTSPRGYPIMCRPPDPTPETHRYVGMWRPPWETIVEKCRAAMTEWINNPSPHTMNVVVRCEAQDIELWLGSYGPEDRRNFEGNDYIGQVLDAVRPKYLAGHFDTPVYEAKRDNHELFDDAILLGDLMEVIRAEFPGSPELAAQDGNFAEKAKRLFERIKETATSHKRPAFDDSSWVAFAGPAPPVPKWQLMQALAAIPEDAMIDHYLIAVKKFPTPPPAS